MLEIPLQGDTGAMTHLNVPGSDAAKDLDGDRQLAVQILTTEQFVLQSARSAASAESSSRSTLFMTVLSATLVALALAAQVVTTHRLLPLALVGLALDFFLGLVTFMRVLENGIEDYLYVKEMNRIRNFYTTVAPETAPYFVLSSHDDPMGIHQSMGMRLTWSQGLLTSASSILVINSAIGAVFCGVAVYSVTGEAIPAIAAGAVVGIGLGGILYRHLRRGWQQAEEDAPPRFPTPEPTH